MFCLRKLFGNCSVACSTTFKHSKTGSSDIILKCKAISTQQIQNFSSDKFVDKAIQNTLADIPEKPKRPVNVFFRYVKMVEPELKKSFPNAKRSKIVQAAAKMYNNRNRGDRIGKIIMSIEEVYEEEYKHYRNELKAYYSKLTPQQIEAMKTDLRLKRLKRSLGLEKPERSDQLRNLTFSCSKYWGNRISYCRHYSSAEEREKRFSQAREIALNYEAFKKKKVKDYWLLFI